MDQVGRGHILQFWVTVENFWQYARPTVEKSWIPPSPRSKKRRSSQTVSLATARKDVESINDMFVAHGSPNEIHFDVATRLKIQELVDLLRDPALWNGPLVSDSPEDQIEECITITVEPASAPFHCLAQAQAVVFDEMKRHDLVSFRKSNQYFQLLEDRAVDEPLNGGIRRLDSFRRKRKNKYVDRFARSPSPLSFKARSPTFPPSPSPPSGPLSPTIVEPVDDPNDKDNAEVTSGLQPFRIRKSRGWRSALSDIDDQVTDLPESELLPTDALETVSEELANIVKEASISTEGPVVDERKPSSLPKISFRKWSKSAAAGLGASAYKGIVRSRSPSPPMSLPSPKRVASDGLLEDATLGPNPQSDCPHNNSIELDNSTNAPLSEPVSPLDVRIRQGSGASDEIGTTTSSSITGPSEGSSHASTLTRPNPRPVSALQASSSGSRLHAIREELDCLKLQLTIVDKLLTSAQDSKSYDKTAFNHFAASRYLHTFLSVFGPGKDHHPPDVVPFLRKSRGVIQREMRDLELQQQLQVQAGYSSILHPDMTQISINGCEFDTDGLKEYVLYFINVSNDTGDDAGIYPHDVPNSWMVSRRYREFLVLHQRLKKKHSRILAGLEFPLYSIRRRSPGSDLL